MYTPRDGLPPPSRRRSGRRRGRNPRLNGGEAETTGDSQKVASLVTVEERGAEGDTLTDPCILIFRLAETREEKIEGIVELSLIKDGKNCCWYGRLRMWQAYEVDSLHVQRISCNGVFLFR
jgi:hypothetical protein